MPAPWTREVCKPCRALGTSSSALADLQKLFGLIESHGNTLALLSLIHHDYRDGQCAIGECLHFPECLWRGSNVMFRIGQFMFFQQSFDLLAETALRGGVDINCLYGR